jgi:hypothetical protein
VDPNLVLQALKGKPFEEVVKPGDTGDDMVMPPDPGYYGNPPAYLFAGGKQEVPNKNTMPFPDNHNPNMDFKNRFPTDLPPVIPWELLHPPAPPKPHVIQGSYSTTGKVSG